MGFYFPRDPPRFSRVSKLSSNLSVNYFAILPYASILGRAPLKRFIPIGTSSGKRVRPLRIWMCLLLPGISQAEAISPRRRCNFPMYLAHFSPVPSFYSSLFLSVFSVLNSSSHFPITLRPYKMEGNRENHLECAGKKGRSPTIVDEIHCN